MVQQRPLSRGHTGVESACKSRTGDLDPVGEIALSPSRRPVRRRKIKSAHARAEKPKAEPLRRRHTVNLTQVPFATPVALLTQLIRSADA